MGYFGLNINNTERSMCFTQNYTNECHVSTQLESGEVTFSYNFRITIMICIVNATDLRKIGK